MLAGIINYTCDCTDRPKGIFLYMYMYIHCTCAWTDSCNVTFSTGDSLAVEVCLLLIEVCLRTYQLGMANGYMEFLEAQYFKGGNSQRGEESPGEGGVEGYRSKLYLFKACLSVLNGNIKTCKKELKSLTNVAGNVSRLSVCELYV